MMQVSFNDIKYFIIFSIVIYFIYDHLAERRIKDEREEFLKLKTFELVQKITLFSITILSIVYFFYPDMPAFVPIILIVVCSMYSEILGKAYFRRKF